MTKVKPIHSLPHIWLCFPTSRLSITILYFTRVLISPLSFASTCLILKNLARGPGECSSVGTALAKEALFRKHRCLLTSTTLTKSCGILHIMLALGEDQGFEIILARWDQPQLHKTLPQNKQLLPPTIKKKFLHDYTSKPFLTLSLSFLFLLPLPLRPRCPSPG